MDAQERTPLLPGSEETSRATDDGHQAPTGESDSHSDSANVRVIFPLRNIALCGVVVLVLVMIEAAALLISIPLNQVIEANICRQLRPDLELQSSACGDDGDVQGELAMLTGWNTTFALLAGIITAIPFGIMADKYGRKSGLCLCVLGITMAESATVIICKSSAITYTV
jgi:MFS family permease